MNFCVPNTYVLIAGAWHGGWVWRDVAPGLRALGHAVSAPTLTGLGERHHNGTEDTNLSTHIEDVVAHITMEGLQSVTLVGWSYGGMVITGVAAMIPDKIKSLIYLDAFVPEDGKALVDYLPPERKAHYDLIAAEGNPIPPLPLASFGPIDPALVEFVAPRLTNQPWRTFYEPVRTWHLPSNITVGYVYCSGPEARFTAFYEKLKKDSHVRTAIIDASHLCMLTAPSETMQLLVHLG